MPEYRVKSAIWDPINFNPEIYHGIHINPDLANELKFNFITGDRGTIYDIRAELDTLACSYGCWGFRVHTLKNFKLDVHRKHTLRTLVPDRYASNVIDATRKYLEYIIEKAILSETIQPEDFYK